MRLAGDAAIFEAMARHFDGARGIPANQQPISVARGGLDTERKLDSFFNTRALLMDKGYSADAALDLADATANGQRQSERPTRRFAAVYGDSPRHLAHRR